MHTHLREEIGIQQFAAAAATQREADYQQSILDRLPPEAHLRDLQDDAAGEVAEVFRKQDDFGAIACWVVAGVLLLIVLSRVLGK